MKQYTINITMDTETGYVHDPDVVREGLTRTEYTADGLDPITVWQAVRCIREYLTQELRQGGRHDQRTEGTD